MAVQVAAAKQAQQEKGSLAGAPEEVKGFLVGRLLERRPELEQELLTFRDHLLAASASADDDAKLKVRYPRLTVSWQGMVPKTRCEVARSGAPD